MSIVIDFKLKYSMLLFSFIYVEDIKNCCSNYKSDEFRLCYTYMNKAFRLLNMQSTSCMILPILNSNCYLADGM